MINDDGLTAGSWAVNLLDDVVTNLHEDEDLVIELALRCFEKASTIVRKRESTLILLPEEYMIQVVDLGQEYWDTICEVCRNICPLPRVGYLTTLTVALDYKKPTVTEGENEETNDIFADALYKGIGEALAKYGEELFNVSDVAEQVLPADTLPKIHKLTDEEINDILDNTDENLVKRFFDLFRNLKTFYVDEDRYSSEDDKLKQREMMAIFYRICKQK